MRIAQFKMEESSDSANDGFRIGVRMGMRMIGGLAWGIRIVFH
jgi:hypothetical protein